MKSVHMLAASAATSIAAVLAADPDAEFLTRDAPDVDTLLERNTKAVEEAVEVVTQVKGKTDELELRIFDIEQKGSRRGSMDPIEAKSWGAQVAESEDVRTFTAAWQPKRAVRVELKTITSIGTSAGPLVTPPYVDQVAPLVRRQLTIRDLLNVVSVQTGTVEYPRQTTRTINAATVAEGALKPESDLAWEMVSVPIRTLAHWVLAARQVMEDAPQLQALVDSELRYGLQLVEEGQLLNGGGTGTDLNGIYTQATAFAAPFDPTTAVNEIDVIGLALLQADNALFPADGIILHPTDWTKMRLLKDADGHYILGDPQAPVAPSLFGRPVVPTPAQGAGTFTVGAFKQGATLYDRMSPEVLVSTEDSDNFRKNLVTVLAEERIGLAVKYPGAFFKGDFATIMAALNV